MIDLTKEEYLDKEKVSLPFIGKEKDLEILMYDECHISIDQF